MRVLTIGILALLVWALPSAAARAGSPEPASVAVGHTQAKKPGLAKKRALKRTLRKCRKIRKKVRRKTCVRKARKRYARQMARLRQPKPKPGRTWRVDVLDTYEEDWFSPNQLTIKRGDAIEWIWSDDNQNPHNVTPEIWPAGVNRNDYRTPNAPSRNYRWVRRFDVAGHWQFACSLHKLMKMTVVVEK